MALRWSADAGRIRVLLTSHRIYYGISIAFAVRSVDHSLFTRLIRWSENQTTNEHFSRLVV